MLFSTNFAYVSLCTLDIVNFIGMVTINTLDTTTSHFAVNFANHSFQSASIK